MTSTVLNLSEKPRPGAFIENGWSYAKVQIEGESQVRREVVDLNLHVRYRLANPYAIRIKCLGIAAVLPIYTMARIVSQAIQGPLLSVKTGVCALGSWIASPCRVGQAFHSLFVEAPSKTVRAVCEIVRAPFYMLAMEAAALYGMIHPFSGRKFVARVEYHWKGEPVPRGSCSGFWKTGWTQPCYLAPCFQPLGKITPSMLVEFERS